MIFLSTFATVFCSYCPAQAGELIGVNKIDYHDTLREITTKAKAEGLEPKDSRIEDIVETGKHHRLFLQIFPSRFMHTRQLSSRINPLRAAVVFQSPTALFRPCSWAVCCGSG